ncbi:MAG: DNA repair protein [Planctomycetes bacterium GWF2_41_51]|nr:MAG: DNA repair protein [Planctomycetes bacterium GWF2_41_51]
MKKALILSIALLFAAGCDSVYYGTMEKFGKHKRDILVDRVEEARDSQEQTKEQFASALEKFKSVVNVPTGKLQVKYDTLKAEFDESEAKAAAVKKRIADVEEVAKDLFTEWKDELEQYKNRELKSSSQKQLDETRKRYNEMIAAMKRAESRIEPVLSAFRDQVLFLKHNLNAQAIASLQTEVTTMETDIGRLIEEMEKSIAEADSFIKNMKE